MPQAISLSICMISPPSFTPVNLLTNLYQVTQSEATSSNSFRDIFITNFRCPSLQRAINRKLQRAITKKNFFF